MKKTIVFTFALLRCISASGQNCDVDFPGTSTRYFSTACGGTSSNLTLGKNTYMGTGDSFTFDVSATVNGNVSVNAQGNAKIVIPLGVTVNIDGNFQLDQKNSGCSSSNPCIFEIEVNGTLNFSQNVQNNLVKLVWSGSGTVTVDNHLDNTSNGCMACGSGGCPSFESDVDCKDDGVGCSSGDFCAAISNPCNSDVIKPIITGCSNIVANITGIGCSQPVSWAPPLATDNCTLSSFTSTHLPGATFPRGTTTVIYTATDASGNSATCGFTVTVNDPVKPIISNCPTNQTIILTGTACTAVVSWVQPTAIDNCAVTSLTSTHSSGSIFNTGTTTVTYTAVDPSGNSSTCSFNVIVGDATPPTFSSCGSNPVVTSYDPILQTAVASWDIPQVTDNCGIVSLTSTASPGNTFPKGVTVVTYTAADAAGNIANCNFAVTISGNSPPTADPVYLATNSKEPTEVCLDISDPDGDFSDIKVVNYLNSNAVITNIGGSCFLYTSVEGYEGSDLFTVTICDDQDPQACSTVNIEIEVKTEAQLQVYKALSPNGDGLNDFWQIKGIEKYPKNKVTIFDRWGSQIYSAEGYNNETVVWGGMRGGKPVPAGTYFYAIELYDETYIRKGPLELIN